MKNAIKYCLLFLLFAQASFAQDTIYDLKTVKIKPTQSLIVANHAGTQKTKVDSITLAQNIGTDLGDLLSANSPVFIKSDGRGALATASFRGTNSNHTQVSWNGIALNSPLLGMVDFSLLPVFVFDEVSLLHGGASVENASGGLGGAVLLNQKPQWDTLTTIKYNQGVGSYSTHHELLHWSLGNKKWNWQSKLFNLSSQNDYPFINRAVGSVNAATGDIEYKEDVNDNAEYSFAGTMQAFHFKPSNNQLLSLFYWGQINSRLIPRATSYEGPNNDNLNRQKLTDHKMQLAWTGFFGFHKLKISTAAVHQHSDFLVKNNIFGLGEVTSINTKMMQHSSVNRFTYDYFKWEKISFKLDVKVDHHHLKNSNQVTDDSQINSRFELKPLLKVGYANKRLAAAAMLRKEVINTTVLPWLPYLGADYQLLKKIPLKARASYTRNIRFPTINDLYWSPGGNIDLKMEQGNMFEGGLEYENLKRDHHLKVGATVYKSVIQNWILWLPSFQGFWQPSNLNKVVSEGFETNVFYKTKIKKILLQMNLVVGYTSATNYHDKQSDAYGKQLVYIPKHSGNINLRLGYKNYYMRYQHNSFSDRFTTTTNDVNARDWLYPYFMNNAAVGAKYKIKNIVVDCEILVNNILNETYHSVLYRPMPRVNYLLTLNFKYIK